MRKTRALAALAVAATLPLAAIGCSSDTSESSAESDRAITVTMTDNAYSPDTIDVAKGETVTFKFVNEGQLVHEAYLGDEQAQEDHDAEMMDGGGHSGMDMGDDALVTVSPGDSAELTYTFDDAGTVLIGCHQPGHWDSGMKATVTAS